MISPKTSTPLQWDKGKFLKLTRCPALGDKLEQIDSLLQGGWMSREELIRYAIGKDSELTGIQLLQKISMDLTREMAFDLEMFEKEEETQNEAGFR